MPFLSYLFWPNPGPIAASKFYGILLMGASFILLSLLIRFCRGRILDPKVRKFSASWANASLWFGVSALVLIVSRNEGIQFVSMRVLWVVWLTSLTSYVAFQVRRWQLRYYEVLPKVTVEDPLAKYLPKKKRK